MKLNPIMLALSLALTSLAAGAQTIDLGSDATGYKRFLLYPHLEKGFEAMKQGNRNRALTEFEQARTIAPNNAVVATYLAEAYRHFGERDRAEALLREQLKRNPADVQLGKALSDLRAKVAPELILTLTLILARSLTLAPTSTSTSTSTSTTAPALALIQTQALANLSSGATTFRVAAHWIRPRKAKLVARSTRARPESQAQAPVSSVTPGYYFADTAYKTSASGDFASALPAAREAARLEPENRAYGKLLVYVLAQSGGYEEAEAMASKLLKDAVADGQELMEQRQAIRRRLAFEHFEAANKALHSDDAEAAVREARLGVSYAPDLLPHRVQLISTQLAVGRLDEANQAATDAIDVLQEEPALLVLRGYARQRLGQWSSAAADFDQAVTHKGLTQAEEHNFRIIAAHAAMAAGEPKRALTLLEPLDAKADEAIGIRRQLASSASQRSLYPNPMKTPVLPTPGVICTGFSFTPSCDVWPGEEPADPARPAAESAYKAYDMRDYAVAAVKANEAVELSPASMPYRLLLVNALVADGQLEQADQSATRFIKMNGDDAEMLAARSGLRQRLGQRELANEDAAAALRSERLSLASEVATLIQLDRKPQARERLAAATKEGLLNDQTDTTLAYLAVLVGDDEGALAAFDRATARGTLPNAATQDAAYAAGRLGRNDQAINYFKKTIDVAEAGPSLLTPQQLFNTRREVADRSRQWGANAALTYRGISPSALAATQSGASNDSLQAGAEAWWRPFDYRDGRVLELYAGVSETLSSKAGFATGAESLQGTLGARVKPLVDVNLVLAIERRFAIGSKSTTDWLPRVAYSADTGTDLRVDVPSWMTATVYAEAGRFIKQRQNYATFEGQVGRSFRLDAVNPKLVIFPHAVLGADYNSNIAVGSKNAVGAGVGVTLRHWFNEDRYNAPRSYADLSLQYRARISGDDRAKGVFLRATFNY
jgi:bacteriophage N4 adsorption protein A